MNIGVILYGPPAAGKDTITGELLALDPRYRQFSRLKARTRAHNELSHDQRGSNRRPEDTG